jgi:hypothetical protein
MCEDFFGEADFSALCLRSLHLCGEFRLRYPLSPIEEQLKDRLS